MKDYYQILGVPQDADAQQIRDRYRHLVSTCHPDKFQSVSEKVQAEEQIKAINEAYAVLGDLEKRVLYDRQRKKTRRVRPKSQSVYASARTAPTPHNPGWVIPDPVASSPIESAVPPVPHLQRAIFAHQGEIIRVWLDRRANVLLLDERNYDRYQRGMRFEYQGGYARYSPVDLLAPYDNLWRLVIDLGGDEGHIRFRAVVLRRGW